MSFKQINNKQSKLIKKMEEKCESEVKKIDRSQSFLINLKGSSV